MGRTLRDLPWYLWPTWPLALTAAWRWRDWIYAPHIWLPLMLLLRGRGAIWPGKATDSEYVLLALPCAVLGAFLVPTLRRSVVNWIGYPSCAFR